MDDDSQSPPDADTRSGSSNADPSPREGAKLDDANGAPGDPAESLDAFIDSIPAAQAPTEEPPAPRGPAVDQHFPLVPPEGYKVSNIFEGLNSPAQPFPEDVIETGAAPSRDTDPPDPAPSADAFGLPLFYEPSAPPPMPEPADWEPPPMPASAAERLVEPAPYPEPADWQPPTPVSTADPQRDETDIKPSVPSDPDRSADGDGDDGHDPLSEALAWPPFPEPPGADQSNADAEPLKPPSLVTGKPDEGIGSPFPAPPAWPPHLDAPDGDAAAPSAAGPSGLPPYIEVSANPDMDRRQEEPPAPALLAELRTAASAPLPEPREVPRFHTQEASRPEVATGATASAGVSARIAAEANATAEALDSLQRLLVQPAPPAAPPPAPLPAPAFRHQPQAPQLAPTPHYRRPQEDPFIPEMPPPMLPLSLPADDDTDRRVYLLGFLTGLMLSIMAGAALYFLINVG